MLVIGPMALAGMGMRACARVHPGRGQRALGQALARRECDRARPAARAAAVAGRRGGNGVRGRRRAGPRAAGEPGAVVVRGGVACTGRTRAVAAATSAGRTRWRVE